MATRTLTKTAYPRRRRLSPEERKRELLGAALDIAANMGLGNLVHAEVARACNVSIATVFLYFPDSETLTRSVVEEVGKFYREQCAEYLRKRKGASGGLQAYGRGFVESVETHPQYAAIFLQWAAASGNEYGIWDLFLEHVRYLETEIKRRIRVDGVLAATSRTHLTDTFVQIYLGGAFVIIRMKFSGASKKKLHRLLDQFTELLTS